MTNPTPETPAATQGDDTPESVMARLPMHPSQRRESVDDHLTAGHVVDMCRVIVRGPVDREVLLAVCAKEPDPEAVLAACVNDMKARGLRFNGETSREAEVMRDLLDALNEINRVTMGSRGPQSSRDSLHAARRRLSAADPIMREAARMLNKARRGDA